MEGDAVRLGLRMIVGLPRGQCIRVEETQPFQSMDDFSRRSGVSSTIAARLAKADAFGSFKLNPARPSLWQALVPTEAKGIRPLFDDLPAESDSTPDLPIMDGREEVFADYRSVGLSLKAHPVSFFRGQMDQLRVVPSATLATRKDGRMVALVGWCWYGSVPEPPRELRLSRLEDETGVANLIIRMDVWERFS